MVKGKVSYADGRATLDNSLALSNLEKLNSQLEQARQSANSSQVQELVSIVQQQKKKIAEQAELIEKLNESDLIVKENDRLKKLNSDLQKSEQNARQEAMTEVSAVKEECAKRERIAESKAQEADKLKSHLEAVEADLSGQIDKKALNLVESKLNALQGVYEAKQRSLDSEYKPNGVAALCIHDHEDDGDAVDLSDRDIAVFVV